MTNSIVLVAGSIEFFEVLLLEPKEKNHTIVKLLFFFITLIPSGFFFWS